MMRVLVVVCVIVCACASAAGAQISTGGAVRGHVKDEQDAVLRDVRITATSPDAPTPYVVTSDETGYYRLLELPPGVYTLKAELDGFATWVREGINVRAGLNVTVPVVMKVSAVNETVAVTVETPLLESARPVQGVNISGELQRSVPLSTRRLWTDYLMLTPGVISFGTGTTPVFYVHGTTQNSHVFQVDGADVMAALQNSNLFANFSTDVVGDVQVKTAAIDASAPLGLGAVTNIAAPSGTNRLTGALTGVWHPLAWNGNNNPSGTVRTLDVKQVDVSAGGPMVPMRAWIFGAYRRTVNTTGIARTPQELAALRQIVPSFKPFDSTDSGNFVFTKSTVRLSPTHEFQGIYNYDSQRSRTGGATAAAIFDERNAGGSVYSARMLSVWGSSFSMRVLASYNDKGAVTTPDRSDLTGRAVYQRAIPSGGVLFGSGLLAVLDNTNAVPFSFPASKSTFSYDSTYYRPGWIGSHELQAGLFLQPRIHDEWTIQYNNNGFHLEDLTLRDPADAGAGLVPFHRRIMDRTDSTPLRIDSRDLAVYIQDGWRPTARLSINAGVRVDFVKRTDRIFDEVTQDSVEIGPRLGAILGVTGDGTMSVRASWGRVHENLSVNQTAAGNTLDGFRDLYDLDLDGTFETVLTTPGRSALSTDRIIDKERYHQSYADEWTLGVRKQWRGQVDTDVSLLRRVYRDRPALVDVNGIYESGLFRGFRDERFNQIYRLTPNVWNWPVVTSLDIRVSKQTRAVQVLGSLTRQWRSIAGTWQPDDPALFIQPDAFRNDRGIGPVSGFDQSSLGTFSMGFNVPWRDYTARIGISYSGPWGLVASAYLSYLSGVWSGPIFTRVAQPDPRYGPATFVLSNGRVVSNPLATTVRFAHAERSAGQFTSDSIRQLNVRAGRVFRVKRYGIEVQGAVFNATNAGTDQNFVFGAGNVMFSPFFRSTTTKQDPRSASITARVTF